MIRKAFIGLASLLLLAWFGFALSHSLLLGFSAAALLSGLAAGPTLVRDLIVPSDDYRGLKNPAAVAILRQTPCDGVTPSDGRMLYDLVLRNSYRSALDLGTARGCAALWIGMAMEKTGGKLITIEIDPKAAAEARENFRRAGLAHVIDSRINDALVEVPSLPLKFDFVFMDLGAPLNDKLLHLLRDRIEPGGAIAAHNAYFFRFEQPAFLAALRSSPNLETSFVPTLSGGISLSVFRK